MWRPDTRVVLAVSGGSDSVAMLVLLHELQHAMRIDCVAHLNHSVRREAEADEQFTRELARQLSVPYVTTRVDVPAIASAQRLSLEVAGRRARRRFLGELRRTRGADCIATAHTRDDQAETVLLRLLRGAGGGGVSGIAPRRDYRVRPLLCASRDELQQELRLRGQPWCEDASNADVSNPRNRVRHELLPYLEQHFNPSARRALARFAEVARGEDAWLARQAAAAASVFVRAEDNTVTIDRDSLVGMPEALARRVVRLAANVAGVSAVQRLDDIDAVLAVARANRGAVEISGLRVEHSGGNVVLVHSPVRRLTRPFHVELAVPGSVRIDQVGWVVEAETASGSGVAGAATPDIAHIDAGTVQGPLIVRSRQPGDRIRPLGLEGRRKKVQDVLVDRKVQRAERDAIPIVTDVHGRIVWVAGHVVSEDFRVTEHTNGMIILKLRRI